MTQFDIVANRPIPNVNLRQIVWQPVKDNGNLSMRLAPIEWQPSGAHACIQMLADDLAKAVEALRKIAAYTHSGPYGQGITQNAEARIARAVLAEMEGGGEPDKKQVG